MFLILVNIYEGKGFDIMVLQYLIRLAEALYYGVEHYDFPLTEAAAL